MQEGLLVEIKGKIYPYDEYEMYLYGYENRYGLLIRRALGGSPRLDTLDSEKGLYEVTPVGTGLKASEIDRISKGNCKLLLEALSRSQFDGILRAQELAPYVGNLDDKGNFFHSVPREAFELFEQVVRIQPERQATHVVEDVSMNPYYPIEEAAKKYGVKTYTLSEKQSREIDEEIEKYWK